VVREGVITYRGPGKKRKTTIHKEKREGGERKVELCEGAPASQLPKLSSFDLGINSQDGRGSAALFLQDNAGVGGGTTGKMGLGGG